MDRYDPDLHARIAEAARRHAHALRDEAISQFWHDAADAAARAARAATRFTARLQRHRRLRSVAQA